MRVILTDNEPAIRASRNPIFPRQPTLRAQRQAAGEFYRQQWEQMMGEAKDLLMDRVRVLNLDRRRK